ncbi:MAG TPA: hypothetical protein VGD35_06430 [Chitinophaga sp.]
MPEVNVLIPLVKEVDIRNAKLTTAKKDSLTAFTIDLVLDTIEATSGAHLLADNFRELVIPANPGDIMVSNQEISATPSVVPGSGKTLLKIKFAISTKVPGGTGFVNTTAAKPTEATNE